MRAVRWERYVPNVEDNRARHAAGRPALVVEIRQPTAKVWMSFRRTVLEDPERRTKLVELIQRYGEQAALRVAVNEEGFGALLWLPCVGKVECPADMIEGLEGEPPADGAALWALRDTLDTGTLFSDVFEALLVRAELEAGLAVPLASASGRPAAPTQALEPAGTAEPVAETVST